jgi:hypothetical protein
MKGFYNAGVNKSENGEMGGRADAEVAVSLITAFLFLGAATVAEGLHAGTLPLWLGGLSLVAYINALRKLPQSSLAEKPKRLRHKSKTSDVV